MSSRKSNPQQYVLDYTSQAAEWRYKIDAALREIAQKHAVGLQHFEFLMWVHNVGEAGLVKSYPQIAHRLWIAPKTAERMVKALQGWGVLHVDDDKYSTKGTGPNRYSIDRAGIAHWRAVARKRMGLEVDEGAGHGDEGAGHGDAPLNPSWNPSNKHSPPLPPKVSSSAGRGVVVVGSSLAVAEKPATAVGQATVWPQATARLEAAGLRATTHVVAEAQCRMTEATLCQAVEFFLANGRAWLRDGVPNPGVIVFWVRQYRQGIDPTDIKRWPTPSQAWLQEQSRQRRASVEGPRMRASAIIREKRGAGVPDEAIRRVLSAHGLSWPGEEP